MERFIAIVYRYNIDAFIGKSQRDDFLHRHAVVSEQNLVTHKNPPMFVAIITANIEKVCALGSKQYQA
jgi:hypothetical protein